MRTTTQGAPERPLHCTMLSVCWCTASSRLDFYKMHQPRQIANLGLAAYKAPVAAVRGYDPTERVAYIRRTLIEEDASYETFDQRTVASSGSDRLLAVREAGHN